mgnify:CR=1 FL=1
MEANVTFSFLTTHHIGGKGLSHLEDRDFGKKEKEKWKAGG